MNPIITDRFDKSTFKVIEVSSKVNIDDVRKFSQARYDELIKVPKTHKGLRRTVIDTITKKAGGMFLWVDLIYKEELRDILSPVKLKEALGKLPEGGLTNLYDHIFFRIERDIGRAKHLALQNLFSWAAYFKEPLSLFNLNEILQISSSDNFDVESIVAETCASLFVLVKTGKRCWMNQLSWTWKHKIGRTILATRLERVRAKTIPKQSKWKRMMMMKMMRMKSSTTTRKMMTKGKSQRWQKNMKNISISSERPLCTYDMPLLVIT
jgi:hypothetical protein